MTILITGAGLIGCHTARLLSERGQRCVLLDRHPAREAIDSIVTHPLVTCLTGDVTDMAQLEKTIEQYQVKAVIHTAALLSTAIRQDPVAGVRVNIMGTMHILELARRHQLARVVLASSSTVCYPTFGDFRGGAFPEDFSLKSLTHRPTSIYAATKVTVEHLGLLYRDLYDVPVVALRYAAVLGAWSGPGTSIPTKVLACLAGPAREGRESVIDDPMIVWRGGEEFVDARDCALANIAALDAAQPRTGVYNISSGRLHTFEDVSQAVRELHPALRVKMTIEPTGGFAGFPHVRHAASDISAARSELGWTPKYSLAQSVEHYAPWCHA